MLSQSLFQNDDMKGLQIRISGYEHAQKKWKVPIARIVQT